jgi:hypothetical protein
MTPNLTGAAAALVRVAQWEADAADAVNAARRALDLALHNAATRPPESDGEDYEKRIREAKIQLEDAEDRALKWLKQLRDFDKSVAPEKRDSSESIKREEGIHLLRHVAVYLRVGLEGLITGLCGEVLACRKPEDVHLMLANKMRENMVGAVENGVREQHLPKWVADAIGEVY